LCYDLPGVDQPIRQGDILYPLPYATLSLDSLQSFSRAGFKASNWNDLMDSIKNDNDDKCGISILVALKKTWGIVASQDCDASNAPHVSIFQIEPFADVYKNPITTTKGWVSTLTERLCKNASWYYLPKDENIGINFEMAVNFHRVIQFDRAELERNKNLRMGRLADFAYEHYREAIAQYYRRYPYDEWYPFNKVQLEYYAKNIRRCEIEEIVPKYPMNEK
jgi:hypothetical protein